MKSTSARRPARPTLGAARPRVTAGCRYGAMESALRPPLPTATRACGHPNPSPLDQRLRAKHHRMDPRKQTPGGRHQIGIPAGFKSESVAGFLLECVAGFIGNRSGLAVGVAAFVFRTSHHCSILSFNFGAREARGSVSVGATLRKRLHWASLPGQPVSFRSDMFAWLRHPAVRI